jgi:hypothetical protein
MPADAPTRLHSRQRAAAFVADAELFRVTPDNDVAAVYGK